MELSALERLKIPPNILTMGKMVSPCFLACFDPMLLILAGNENMH